jgi:osmotically-inducible protein OsmY
MTRREPTTRAWNAGALGLVLALLAALSAAAEAPDVWIETKARIRLLTAEDVDLADVVVEARRGRVTLHGKVGSPSEKQRAEAAVRTVDGVHEVTNRLQVVSRSRREPVDEKDDAIRVRVDSCLERDGRLEDVEVASVADGVVLLSGEVATPGDELRAIEAVRACTAVRGVASQIRTRRP